MVSIIPRVDVLGNTVVDWICKLSYFRLDTLHVVEGGHLKCGFVYTSAWLYSFPGTRLPENYIWKKRYAGVLTEDKKVR